MIHYKFINHISLDCHPKKTFFDFGDGIFCKNRGTTNIQCCCCFPIRVMQVFLKLNCYIEFDIISRIVRYFNCLTGRSSRDCFSNLLVSCNIWYKMFYEIIKQLHRHISAIMQLYSLFRRFKGKKNMTLFFVFVSLYSRF